MLEKNFCLKKRWHMGQVWKDEKRIIRLKWEEGKNSTRGNSMKQ